MKKIGIYCLAHRRPEAFVIHAKQLAKCKNNDFHFYLFGHEYSKELFEELVELLKDNISIYSFPRNNMNYMSKIHHAISLNHEYSIKHDEDCFLTTESWDRLFALADQLNEENLFGTGVISNGIPTVDMFLENHTPEIKNELFEDFCKIKLGPGDGADYSSLNEDYKRWDSHYFYSKVKNFNHYYKGIHPVRVSLDSVKKINNYIISNFKQVMSPKQTEVIYDNSIYPYFCNSVMIIKTKQWKEIIEDKTLYVDGFDEVPLNKYRDKTSKKIIFDTGIPILHTMYNWTPDWEYENNLIKQLGELMES